MNIRIIEWIRYYINSRYNIYLDINIRKNYWEISIEKKKLLLRPIIPSLYITTYRNTYASISLESAISIDGEFNIPAIDLDKEFKIKIINNDIISINYDIFGFIFWTLNRLEEFNYPNADRNGRFPGLYSVANKYDYLHRPVVDEWLIILSKIIKKYFDINICTKGEYEFISTHDVDRPSRYLFGTYFDLCKSLASDLIRRKKYNSLNAAYKTRINSSNKISDCDPYNTFDWIEKINNKFNIKSIYFFLSGNTSKYYDSDYDINDPRIINLIKQLSKSSKLGVHPSYNTMHNQTKLGYEVDKFYGLLDKYEIYYEYKISRMHYLRLRLPDTWTLLNNCDVEEDYTLGYADLPGFRAGTCHRFKPFNILENRMMKFNIYPLIAMDGTFIDKEFLNLGANTIVINKINELKIKCQYVRGNMILLWHNNRFEDKKERNIYKEIIKCAAF